MIDTAPLAVQIGTENVQLNVRILFFQPQIQNWPSIQQEPGMDWRDRIVSDPDILVGKPVIKGTRISVQLILGWLAAGWTHDQLLEAYPHIVREDILAALAFAGE